MDVCHSTPGLMDPTSMHISQQLSIATKGVHAHVKRNDFFANQEGNYRNQLKTRQYAYYDREARD